MAELELNPSQASLLGLLHDRPMTGWGLLQTIERTLGCFWNVTTSHVYRELKRLEEGGLIEGGERGPRATKAFSITDAGRAAFVEWIQREPGEEIIRFPLLVTLFFGRHIDDATLAGHLAKHRRIHAQRLDEYRELYACVEDDPYLSATVRFGIVYEEAALGWFESLPKNVRPPDDPDV